MLAALFKASICEQRTVATLGRPVNSYEEVELALGGLHLVDVDVEVADEVTLELFLGGLVAFDLGPSRDAVALQAAMRRGVRQMREGRLQRVEAVIQGRQSVLAKGPSPHPVRTRRWSTVASVRVEVR